MGRVRRLAACIRPCSFTLSQLEHGRTACGERRACGGATQHTTEPLGSQGMHSCTACGPCPPQCLHVLTPLQLGLQGHAPQGSHRRPRGGRQAQPASRCACGRRCLCKGAQALEPASTAAARQRLVWALAAAAAALSMATLAVYCAALAACSRLGGLSAGARGAGRSTGLCASRPSCLQSARRGPEGRLPLDAPGLIWHARAGPWHGAMLFLLLSRALKAARHDNHAPRVALERGNSISTRLRVRGQAGLVLRPGRARLRQAPRRSSWCGRTSLTARAST